MNKIATMTFQRFVDILPCVKPILTYVTKGKAEEPAAVTKYFIRFHGVKQPVTPFSEVTLQLKCLHACREGEVSFGFVFRMLSFKSGAPCVIICI
jgi:hypothetical protein